MRKNEIYTGNHKDESVERGSALWAVLLRAKTTKSENVVIFLVKCCYFFGEMLLFCFGNVVILF
jgi:hypothetical protein